VRQSRLFPHSNLYRFICNGKVFFATNLLQMRSLSNDSTCDTSGLRFLQLSAARNSGARPIDRQDSGRGGSGYAPWRLLWWGLRLLLTTFPAAGQNTETSGPMVFQQTKGDVSLPLWMISRGLKRGPGKVNILISKNRGERP
jgi:hypothetical protein